VLCAASSLLEEHREIERERDASQPASLAMCKIIATNCVARAVVVGSSKSRTVNCEKLRRPVTEYYKKTAAVKTATAPDQ
jgi:hypothetical protein